MICSYLAMTLLPTFILRRAAGSMSPASAYLPDSSGSAILRPGLRRAVHAGTEVSEEARQGAEMRSPVVAMGTWSRSAVCTRWCRARLSGKGPWGKGCLRGEASSTGRRGVALCSLHTPLPLTTHCALGLCVCFLRQPAQLAGFTVSVLLQALLSLTWTIRIQH